MYVQNSRAESAAGTDILKLRFGLLEPDRAIRLLDIKKIAEIVVVALYLTSSM